MTCFPFGDNKIRSSSLILRCENLMKKPNKASNILFRVGFFFHSKQFMLTRMGRLIAKRKKAFQKTLKVAYPLKNNESCNLKKKKAWSAILLFVVMWLQRSGAGPFICWNHKVARSNHTAECERIRILILCDEIYFVFP